MKNSFSAIGQDSHRFVDANETNGNKELILAGVTVPNHRALLGNSDADVIFHAITNAISGITCINVLGDIADEMCKKGIRDSSEYLKYAIKTLGDLEIVHVSLSVECKSPKITPLIPKMRENISKILDVEENHVGITATSGENLTEFGKGHGIFATCIITVR